MLTIITHCNVNRDIDRSKCFDSIERALGLLDCDWNILPLDCKTHNDFLIARHESVTSRKGFIAFVDDDDWIEPDAIRLLLGAIEQNPNTGIVYSDEGIAHDNCDIICSKAGTEYGDMLYGAGRMHHICAINSEHVTSTSLHIALKAGCGIEWAMKAQAELTAGAVYIPKKLYNYRIHNDRITNQVSKNFNLCHDIFIPQFKQWQKYHGTIPIYHEA